MTLRPAAPEDAEAVTAIWNRIITETSVTFTTTPKTAAEVAGLITARAPAFIVAEGQGQVLGFASYAPFRSGPGYAHTMEHTILIAPQGQGRGLGRALMLALETTAREAGGALPDRRGQRRKRGRSGLSPRYGVHAGGPPAAGRPQVRALDGSGADAQAAVTTARDTLPFAEIPT